MMDFGSFVQQMLPFIVLWIALPMVLLIVYFTTIKPALKKRKAAKLAAQGITPEKPASNAPSALDMLRQARPTEAANAVPRSYDTGDLPDLDVLLKTPAKPAVRATLREIPPEPQQLRLNTGRTTAAKELLTILRDETDGRLMVQIGSTGYRTLVDTPDAKKVFSSLMKELGSIILTPDTFVEDEPAVPDNLVDEMSDDMPSIADLARAKIAEAEQEAEQPDPVPVKKSAAPPRMADGSIPGALPSYRLDDHPSKVQFNRVGMVKKVDYVPAPDLDIPSAIEAYLQYKIQHNPEYQGREIHVVPAIGGGVRIQVGDKFYDGVDEVRDPAVKHFIKEAIAEWQELS